MMLKSGGADSFGSNQVSGKTIKNWFIVYGEMLNAVNSECFNNKDIKTYTFG